MMNRCVLVGRMVKDVDLRYTPNGVAVASFTLAVNRTFTNQQGEREADFINCVVWRKAAENTANFCKKGSLVGVDGRIQTRSFDGQDGKKVYVTEVLAESVQFLESRSSQNKENSSDQSNLNNNTKNNHSHQREHNQGYSSVDEDPFANRGGQIDINDDLPF
ncbi:single-stranded DNA-binding protein [Bacillus sp. FJAT-29937]|uniref:single-stranded DNA-binding protein n=1 Tax=Bacillus sp. FJAT-29937 TaxID=1720553 RepID=UPI00082DBD1D|nr:single-stranded DNA-binding protein [Bacillus sp. FJAT-29937]